MQTKKVSLIPLLPDEKVKDLFNGLRDQTGKTPSLMTSFQIMCCPDWLLLRIAQILDFKTPAKKFDCVIKLGISHHGPYQWVTVCYRKEEDCCSTGSPQTCSI